MLDGMTPEDIKKLIETNEALQSQLNDAEVNIDIYLKAKKAAENSYNQL